MSHNVQPLQRVPRGNECEGGDDHFPGQPKGPDGDLQADGCIARRYAILDSDKFRNPPFEFLNKHTVIGQPSPRQRAIDSFLQMASISDIGLPTWSCSGKAGWPPKIARSVPVFFPDRVLQPLEVF